MNNESNNAHIDSVVEIEVYGKSNQQPPKAKSYIIRVDKNKYEVLSESITGQEILLLAEKTPVTNFRLDQKLNGGVTKKIELNEVVNLLTPGIERFMTLPLDQTEG